MGLKGKFLEVFTAMVSRTHHQFNKKVYCQSSRATIPLLKHSQELVKPELLPLPPFSLLMLHRITFRHLSCHQLESSHFRLLTLSIQSASTKMSRFTHVSVEPVLERMSRFSNLECSSLSELQVESTI